MAKKAFTYDKIKVKVGISLMFLYSDLCDGMTVESLISRSQALLEHYPMDAKVRLISDWDGGGELLLTHYRDETDTEQASRIKRYESKAASRKTAAEKRHAADLKRLETLKKQVQKLESTLHPTV